MGEGTTSAADSALNLDATASCTIAGCIWGDEARARLAYVTPMTVPDALTSRERQVIEALAGGKSTHEIAAALRLSPHNIRNQRRSDFEKLGATSLIEAMHRLGWVQVD